MGVAAVRAAENEQPIADGELELLVVSMAVCLETPVRQLWTEHARNSVMDAGPDLRRRAIISALSPDEH
jgi:hypothetical protein